MKPILIFGTLILYLGLAQAKAEVKIEKPFVSPGAMTVKSETPAQINFRYSPADYSGDFTLIEINKKGKRIKTIAKIPSNSNTKQILGNSKFLITKQSLHFNTNGTHYLRILGEKAESEFETIEVFPPGIPTSVSVDLSSIVKWRGREVIGNRLHVQLRKKNDYKLAKQLAESVSMNLVGYFKEIGTWQFGFLGKGSAAEIEKAYKTLKSNRKVFLVEPDGVTRAMD